MYHVIPATENISEFEGKPFYSLQAYYDEVGKCAKPWFEKIMQAPKGLAVSEDNITTDIFSVKASDNPKRFLNCFI